ncbi:MAG: glycosyltransferase family 2 protein [Saprospiraceae bacterium]|nr:glycosyltransferase family 2 protein [Saprospiraceae bacterium]
MYSFKFTIFTPTYNRSKTLGRVFKSLQEQTFKDFEWLIIDDGSTDETKNLVESWVNVAGFEIRYVYQANTHKFFTILKAAALAKGAFFYTVDSDDELLPNALELLYQTWMSIPVEKRSGFSGVTARCMDQYGKEIGSVFPHSPLDSDTLETTVKFKIAGEKSGFQRTDIMQKFSFGDEYKNKGYIPEGLLWISIANQGYKTRYINEIVRVYYVDEGGSIMSTNNFKANSFGKYKYALLFMNSFRLYYLYNPKHILGQMRNYIASGLIQQKTIFRLYSDIRNIYLKILFIFMLPMAYLFLKKQKQ